MITMKGNVPDSGAGTRKFLVFKQGVVGEGMRLKLSGWHRGSFLGALEDFLEKDKVRIAAFDMDGTLWPEKPFFNQTYLIQFHLERLRAAGWPLKHPLLKETDIKEAMVRLDYEQMRGLLTCLYRGVHLDTYRALTEEFLDQVRHPDYGKKFHELTYAPMKHLVQHLVEEGYAVYFVTGSDQELVRGVVQRAFGLPPSQVLASRAHYRWSRIGEFPDEPLRSHGLLWDSLPEVMYLTGRRKSEQFAASVGSQPSFVFGNTDGDLPLMHWALQGEGPRLAAFLVHDDPREHVYNHECTRLLEVHEKLQARGDERLQWVSMKKEFSSVW
jgi:hypothetical protein